MATVGKTTDGTNAQTFSGDRIYLSTATPSSGGTLTGGGGRIRLTSAGSTSTRIVVFADNGGTPNGGAFLAASDPVTVNWTTVTDTVWTFSGADQITLVSGTPYWFGFWSDDPGVPSYEYKRDNTAGVVHFAADTYSTTLDPTSPFTSGGTANGPHNCYLEYTEAGGTVVKDLIGGFGFIPFPR
jgi:hypothetical protein